MDGLPNLTADTATNRITASGFEYDAAENMTKALAPSGMGVTHLNYEYDAANRLREVRLDNGAGIQAFLYGSTNARLLDYDYAANLNKFSASVGGTVLAEYTETTVGIPTWQRSNFYLGSRLIATNSANGTSQGYTQYHHADRLGTKLITDDAGGLAGQATLPFGTALNAESTITNNQRRFTSYERSTPTGLDYALNRTYDPKQSRFTQVDPIGMSSASIGNPQSNNLYAYVQNMPTDFVDPSGLQMVARTSCRNVLRTAYVDGQLDSAWYERVCETRWDWVDDGDWGGGGGGGGGDDVEKDYLREFRCNKLAKDIFHRLRSRFSNFANFVGRFGPANRALAIVTFGNTMITKGAQVTISNGNIIGSPPYSANRNFNVSVTVGSVSTMASSSMGFSFTTDPGHVLYPATISFTATDTGPGKVSFGVSVRGNFASWSDQGLYRAGGNGLEDKIWNNLIDNVSRYCGNK